MKHLHAWSVGLWILTLGVVEGVASAQAQPDFVNVPFAPNHVRQKLDIYLPAPSANPQPVIVWIHGGGWQRGDKSSAAAIAQPLLDMGFAVVAVNYRYSWQAAFPAQLHDCRGAVRWMRSHA